jgi:hypothetical protein
MKKMLLTLTAFCLFFLSNCGKDDDDDDNNTNQPPALTKESLAGNYKLNAIWLKTSALPSEINVTDDRLDPCEKDDIYMLKTDFTYTYSDAGTKCTPPGDGNGTWGLPGNDKIDLDGTRFDVVKWDGTQLHISQSGTDPTTGQSGTLRVEFTKQP